jgi:hypothetical protein
MSDAKKAESEPADEPEGQSNDFNLTLAYSLLAIALIAAICIAIFIVLPFYHRR